MGELFDYESARQRKAHERREAKVRKLRSAFRAARQSWSGEGSAAKGGLTTLLKRRKGKGKKKK